MSPKPLHASLRRPLVLWLVVLLALFGALAPTLSHALARGAASPLREVCTSSGPRWAAIPMPTDSPNGQESAPTLVHCPFCLLFHDRVAPPPHPWLHLFVVSGEYEAPTIRPAFFFLPHFALTPPSRGPPHFNL